MRTNRAEHAIPQPGTESWSHQDPRTTPGVPWRRAWRHRGGAAEALGVGVENSRGTHVRHSFTSEPCPRSARVFRWCISEEIIEAWQRWTTPVPRAINMLTLAMRRQHEDSKDDGHAQQRSREGSGAATGGSGGNSGATTGGDEFVDILQVQQLLLDTSNTGPGANGGRGRGRGREPPPPRLLDASAFAAPSYYYGSYGTHLTPPAASVDDLVALWFAGPSTSGAFLPSVVDVVCPLSNVFGWCHVLHYAHASLTTFIYLLLLCNIYIYTHNPVPTARFTCYLHILKIA